MYTNYPVPLQPIQQVYYSENTHGSTTLKGSTVTQTALLHTRYTDLYSTLTYIALRVQQAMYTSDEDPWCLVQ